MATRKAHDFQALEVPGAATFDGLAGGWIGFNRRTTDANGIGAADVTILTEDVQVNANRLIEIVAKGEVKGTGGHTEAAVRAWRGSTLLDRHMVGTAQEDVEGDVRGFTLIAYDLAPAAGTHNYKVTVRTEYPGGNPGPDVRVIVNPGIECTLVVKDVGPWP